MPADMRRVVETLWGVLGLGPVPSPLGNREEFQLEDAACIVERAPSGTEVILRLSIGALPTEPFAAADRLRRLLRVTLGLSMVNRAALVCSEMPDDDRLRELQQGGRIAPLTFDAVVLIETDQRQVVIDALQDVVQMRNLALPYLSAGSAGTSAGGAAARPAAARQGAGDDPAGFVIFQP